MTKDQANKWWKEIEALQAGKVVQSRTWYFEGPLLKRWRDWADDPNPPFHDPEYEFRVKAEPRRVWLHSNRSGGFYVVHADTGCPDCTEFVEVIHDH